MRLGLPLGGRQPSASLCFELGLPASLRGLEGRDLALDRGQHPAALVELALDRSALRRSLRHDLHLLRLRALQPRPRCLTSALKLFTSPSTRES